METLSYDIQTKPVFQIKQKSNDIVTQIINPAGSLYVEDMFTTDIPQSTGDSCFNGLRERVEEYTKEDIFGPSSDIKTSISLGFWYATSKLFGLPEREDTLALKRTDGGHISSQPYKIWATDQFAHIPNNPQALYGSIPYVNAQSSNSAASALWINSARTFVDIIDEKYGDQDGSRVTFSSSGGRLEIFLFASSAEESGPFNRVKYLNQDLATVTGHAAMPAINTLGYHFCKYANVSADILM